MSRDCPTKGKFLLNIKFCHGVSIPLSHFQYAENGFLNLGSGGGGGSRACHSCGEEGHMSRDCPTKGELLMYYYINFYDGVTMQLSGSVTIALKIC